jgi:hypothetical protein
LLADQQKKHSDSYQHRNQSTDDKRSNPMPSLDRLRSSAFLGRSNTQPEEKVAHSTSLSAPQARRAVAAMNKCLAKSNKTREEGEATKKRDRP